MGLRIFPGNFLVRVWSLVAIRAEMLEQHDQTCPNLSTIHWPCMLSAQCLFCTSECSYFSVLRPILLKLHILTRLIESFARTYRSWWCAEEKLHFTPVHTLRQLKRDEAAVSTTSEDCRVLSKVRLENCTQVWGWAKFGQRVTHGWGKIVLHTCSDLSEPVQTCPHLSTTQWPYTLITQCHFLHFRRLFVLWSYILSCRFCILQLA